MAFDRKKYSRDWVRNRRASFFEGKKCVICGYDKKLELDHINPETKISHQIWSWSAIRRDLEILKCQVLCEECHKSKSAIECSIRTKGIPRFNSRSCDIEVSDLALFLYVVKGYSRRKVSYFIGVHQGTLSKWIYGARGAEWLKRQAHNC